MRELAFVDTRFHFRTNLYFKTILSFQLMSSFCSIYTGFKTVTRIHINVNFQAFTHLSNKQDLLTYTGIIEMIH